MIRYVVVDSLIIHSWARIAYFLFCQTKLSALLEFLSNIWNDTSQHRDAIKNLCVAAYPDIQPWQVRKACLGSPLVDGTRKTASPGEDQEDLYFAYLSQLLDPVEGHESARRDSKLVIVSCWRS